MLKRWAAAEALYTSWIRQKLSSSQSRPKGWDSTLSCCARSGRTIANNAPGQTRRLKSSGSATRRRVWRMGLGLFPKTVRCAPELLMKDLSGKKYLVTGANSGVGMERARQLVKQGAHVVLGCRRVEAGKNAMEGVEGPGSWEVLPLDLGDLASVRSCAEAYLVRLDGLVNNAGLLSPQYAETKDGFERQFGVNHLGHFLLTELLLDVLKRSAPARIVLLSSCVHAGSESKRPTIVLDDLKWERHEYCGEDSYAQSKLTNVLHARTLSKKLESTGVTPVSGHPGWARSNLAGNIGPAWIQNVLMLPLSPVFGMMSSFDAAQVSLHCILDDDVPKHAGENFSQSSILYSDDQCQASGLPLVSPNPNAHDDNLGQQLFQKSVKLVGLM